MQACPLAALPSRAFLPPCERDARIPSTRGAGNAGVPPALPTAREKTYPFKPAGSPRFARGNARGAPTRFPLRAGGTLGRGSSTPVFCELWLGDWYYSYERVHLGYEMAFWTPYGCCVALGFSGSEYVGLMPVVLLDNIVLDWSRQGIPAVNDVLTHYRSIGCGLGAGGGFWLGGSRNR